MRDRTSCCKSPDLKNGVELVIYEYAVYIQSQLESELLPLTVFDNSCGLNDLDFRKVNSEAAALYTSSSKYSIVAKLHKVVPISFRFKTKRC